MDLTSPCFTIDSSKVPFPRCEWACLLLLVSCSYTTAELPTTHSDWLQVASAGRQPAARLLLAQWPWSPSMLLCSTSRSDISRVLLDDL